MRPLISAGILLGCAFMQAIPLFSQTVTDPDFRVSTVQSGNGVTTVKFLPNGNMLAAEKQGRVLLSQRQGNGAYGASTPLLNLIAKVDPSVESGMLGLAIDPNVLANRFIYLFYTTPTDQRLVRYSLNTGLDAIDTTSESILLSGLPRSAPHHKAGNIDFHPADTGHIFISLGDDDMMDAAQDLKKYEGKILRIHKGDGNGVADNPFYDSNPNSIPSRIWAYGFRNPYRFTFVPQLSNVLFASENGGPAGQRDREDRIVRVTKGANCSWSAAAYSAGAGSAWFSPAAGCISLAHLPPSVVGIAIAKGGNFGNPSDGSKSILYWGTWSNGLYRYQFTDDSLKALEPYPNQGSQVFARQTSAMHLQFGPDGSLYGSAVGVGGALGGWYNIQRYSYNGPASVKSGKSKPKPSGYQLAIELSANPGGSSRLYLINLKGEKRALQTKSAGAYLSRE